MAQAKSTKLIEFDSIVIGGGLSGLLIANQLENTGRKVALIEALDVLGGNSRPFKSPIGMIDNGLKLVPETEMSRAALEWLPSVLNIPVEHSIIDAPPVTYDNGKMKPFVGFGDQATNATEEIAYYTNPQRFRLSSTPKDWIPSLTESFTGTLFLQSHVTKIQVEDSFVIELLVNGAKRLSAHEYYFCAHPQQLTRLLPEACVPVRLRQKLARGSFWTSVHLDVLHAGQVTDLEAVHVLRGANEDPCFGVFHPPSTTEDGTACQLSQWVALIPHDLTDDAEEVAAALKKIKKQVKRVYETSFDKVLFERILISPSSHGDTNLELSADMKWPKIDNLWLGHSLFSSQKNVVGSMSQAQLIGSLISPTAPVDPDEEETADRPQMLVSES